MGAAFARTVLGLERPRVALLNIGEEELKGTDEIRDAATLLRGAHAADASSKALSKATRSARAMSM